MFTIPVGDLLLSHSGDSKNFSFDGEIFDGFYPDINFLEPLHFKIRLLVTEEGIHAFFSDLQTKILYENQKQSITISQFDRLWKNQIDPLDPDDIYEINHKNSTIDLSPIIREELIMAFHNNNL